MQSDDETADGNTKMKRNPSLMNHVVHFDLPCVEFLHKLGEGRYHFQLNDSIDALVGGFGSVRACKFRKAAMRYRSPVSASTAANSSDEEEKTFQATQPEESKFARAYTNNFNAKVRVPPRATFSNNALGDVGSLIMQSGPKRDAEQIYAVKIISKKKVFDSG